MKVQKSNQEKRNQGRDFDYNPSFKWTGGHYTKSEYPEHIYKNARFGGIFWKY